MRRWTDDMDPGKDEPFDRESWRRLLGADRGAPTQGTDQRILAEARRALTPRVGRWWLPASLAASLLLAVLIVQWQLADSVAPALVTESDVLSAPAPVATDDYDAPAAAFEAAPPRQDAPATSSGYVAPPAIDLPALESRTAREAVAPAAKAAATAPAPPPLEPVIVVTGARRAAESAADVPAAAAPAQAESSAVHGNLEMRKQSSDGRSKEADAELARLWAADPDWPTEVDTVVVGRPVKLQVQGEILRKRPDGSLVQVVSGDTINPGEMLLVRKGASFEIEGDRIGPESHGDRWVQFR